MLVSVIIPALNEAGNIEATIAAARQTYSPAEVEILVVDGGSTDGTPHKVPSTERLVLGPRGRASQMHAGVQAGRGQVLVFCHADTRLPPGWREAVVTALAQPGVSGGAFRIRILPARGILHLLNRLWLPAHWSILFGDQCQFMTRLTYDRVGGFPILPLMEDVEMGRRLHRSGRLVRLPLYVTSSSRRFVERGPLRQALTDLWLWSRYLFLGASAEEVARLYRSSREQE